MRWVWAFGALATLVVAKDINKVSVELEANWNSGPLYLEATEFIHSLKNDDVTINKNNCMTKLSCDVVKTWLEVLRES